MHHRHLWLFSLVLLLAACEEPVLFSEPQPEGEPALARFPQRWCGTYLSVSDSALLEVDPLMVWIHREWDVRAAIAELDSGSKLIGDTLLVHGEELSMPVVVRGDSLFGRFNSVDTLFTIDAQHVLKREGGSLYLNSSEYTGAWEVMRMNLKGGRLALSEIRDPESLDALNEVLELPGDTVSTPLVVTPRQFKRIAQHGGFLPGDEYIRVRK